MVDDCDDDINRYENQETLEQGVTPHMSKLRNMIVSDMIVRLEKN